jgi:hypothetical protein
MAIESPNFTQIPNIVFDYWLPRLKPASSLVLLIICRKIFGWHRSDDQISKSQLCKTSGLSKNTIQTAIEELEFHSLIRKHQNRGEYGYEANTYSLTIEKPEDTIYSQPPIQNLGGGRSNSDLGGVGQVLTQGRSNFDHTKERPSKEIHKDNKSAPPPLPDPSDGRAVSSMKKYNEEIARFMPLAKSFSERLKEKNPKITAHPDLTKWSDSLRLLAKDGEHGNTIEDIEKAIDYVLKSKPSANGFCWGNVILSPNALRKQFPKIWAEMHVQGKTTNSNPEDNETIAKKIYHKFKNRSDIDLGYDYLEFNNGMTVEHIKFSDKDFMQRCLHQIKKRSLEFKDV